MILQTHQSHSSIRNAVQSYTEAKRTGRSEAAQASSSTDMEVDVVRKDGHKGKSRGGKGKSKTPKGDECYICGSRGHGKKDCWYKVTKGNKGKGKVKGKGKRKGKGKDKDNPVTEVSQEDSQSSNNSQIVANFTPDWIFAVTWADNWEKIHESGQRWIRPRGAAQSLQFTVLFFQGWTLEWCATPMAAKYQLTDEDGFAFDWRMDR